MTSHFENDDAVPLPEAPPPESDDAPLPLEALPPGPDGPSFGPPQVSGGGGGGGGGGIGRINLPHSIESEREILSAVLVDPNVMDLVRSQITHEEFYYEQHSLLFEVMAELDEHNIAIDPVTLPQALKDRGRWEKVGGMRAFGELLDRHGTVANVEHYCNVVREKALQRKMIEAAREIETAGFGDVSNTEEFLDASERAIFKVLENRAASNLRKIDNVVVSALDKITQAFDTEDGLVGVGTGFKDFDSITHGLQGGDLIIIAARPAMGKTSFVLNLATNAALRHNAGVVVFSLEMPSDQLATRMLAAEARIDVSRMRGGNINEDEWPKLTEAADRLSRANLYLDDTPGVTPAAIRAVCRRLKRRNGLNLVVIDYLQLMSGGAGQQSREQEISYISRSLKGLAKDLDAPVIALSQLNRGVESRTDKRPMMSDLRESGAIEQDADIICFLYRDEVYNKDVEESAKGLAELIISKHRNGPTGTVKLKFWNQYTRFDSLEQRDFGVPG